MYNTSTHLVDLSVSHQLLHWVFAVEAVTSEYLNSIRGHLVGNVSGEGLGNGGVVGVPATLVHLPGSPLVRQPGQLHLHRHLSEEE